MYIETMSDKNINLTTTKYCEYIMEVQDQLRRSPMGYIALLIDAEKDGGVLPYIAVAFPNAKMAGEIADGRLRILVYKE